MKPRVPVPVPPPPYVPPGAQPVGPAPVRLPSAGSPWAGPPPGGRMGPQPGGPQRIGSATAAVRNWPGPAGPPSRRVLVVATVAGIGVAGLVPGDAPGVGWPLAALVVVGAMLAIGWRPLRPPGDVLSRRAALAETGWMPAAAALAGVAALRDAGWLVTPALLTAVGAGSLAVAGRSFRSVVRGGIAVPVAAARGTAWAARAVRTLPRTAGSVRLGASLLVGIGLLAVFAPLLASADPAFARVLGALLPTVDDGSASGWLVRFGMGAAGLLGVAFLLAGPPAAGPAPVRASRLRPREWATPMALLVALFALFVGVALTTLFGTDEHVRATTGLTYAEYARGGFWQLLAVTVLTLVVLVLGARWAPADRPLVRFLLSALAGLTLVIVASAVSRMWLYQQAYGFTVLRLLVGTCELWLGAVFGLALVRAARGRPGNPARAMVVTGVATLLALAVLDPERFVADHDISRYAATGRIDVDYLSGLSADAVPALATLPEPLRGCALAAIDARLRDAADGSWRSANTSRAEARRILAGLHPSC